MAAVNGEHDGGTAAQEWSAMCEQHAAEAAEKFAKSVRHYLQEHPNHCRATASREFGDKFVEFFLEHLEIQTMHKHLANGTPRGTPHTSPAKRLVGVAGGGVIRDIRPPPLTIASRSHTIDLGEGAMGGLSVSNPVHDDIGSPDHADSVKQKSIFRKISFRTIRAGSKPLRHLFKQHSDEVDISHNNNSISSMSSTDTSHTMTKKKKHRHEKHKASKVFDNSRKEGIVFQLMGEDFSGKTKWEKCRLVLLKTTGGYMLEFYSPPKVKPISWHICCLFMPFRLT